MTTIKSVGFGDGQVQQQPQSSGSGILAPTVGLLAGGGIGYAIPKQPSQDEFKKMVKDDKVKYTTDPTDAEKDLVTSAKKEIEAADKAEDEKSKTDDKAKTDDKKGETKPETTEAKPEVKTSEAKTPEQIELDNKVKSVFGEKRTDVASRVLLDGNTIEEYTKEVAEDEKSVAEQNKKVNTFKEQIKAKESAISRAQTVFKDELNIASTEQPIVKAKATAKINGDLIIANNELKKAKDELENVTGSLPTDEAEAKVAEKQAKVDSLNDMIATPQEKSFAKADKEFETAKKEYFAAREAADKAETESNTAKMNKAADAKAKAKASILAKNEVNTKEALLNEARDVRTLKMLADPAQRQQLAKDRIAKAKGELEGLNKSLTTEEETLAKSINETGVKKVYLAMAETAGENGKITRETFIDKVGNGLKDEVKKLADGVGAKLKDGDATKTETALEKAFKAVSGKLEKIHSWKLGAIGAGIGLVAGVIANVIFAPKNPQA